MYKECLRLQVCILDSMALLRTKGRSHGMFFSRMSMQCRPQQCKSASRQLLWDFKASSRSQTS